jgi:hypothetical protein
MKHIGLDTVTKWKAKINASPEKQITLNMTEEMVEIYTRIILKALFGEDISSAIIDFQDLETGFT